MLEGYANLLIGQGRLAEKAQRHNLSDGFVGQMPHHKLLLFFGLTGFHWLSLDIQALESIARQYLSHGQKFDLPETTSVADYCPGIIAYLHSDLEVATLHFAVGAYSSYTASIHFQLQEICCLALAYLADDRLEKAEVLLCDQQSEMLERGGATALTWLRACAAEIALARGELPKAVQRAQSYQPFPAVGLQMLYFPQLTWVKVMLAQGTDESLQKAAAALSQLLEIVRNAHPKPTLLALLPYLALVHDRAGDRSLALAELTEAIHLAEPNGRLPVFVDPGRRMAHLLRSLAALPADPEIYPVYNYLFLLLSAATYYARVVL